MRVHDAAMQDYIFAKVLQVSHCSHHYFPSSFPLAFKSSADESSMTVLVTLPTPLSFITLSPQSLDHELSRSTKLRPMIVADLCRKRY